MSGHSKWATTKHRKSAVDAKKGKAFSKIAKLISVAAREGANPEMNFALRLMIDKAKAVNMPKENIDRAIARGAGTGEGDALESVVYEGMAPGGASVIVEAVTDNKNRTFTNIKTMFNKHGGNMEAKVMWQFAQKGVIGVEDLSALQTQSEREGLELTLIDAGAEDISYDENVLTVVCPVHDFKKVSDAISNAGLIIADAGLEYIATNSINPSPEDQERIEKFIEILEEDDDVDSVYTNVS
ncbi:YebC/PmpR family DNA-binding transcriptional regulator [Patescibacteria group bacterium]|nr:YebC/PmpR family DNA-binding transcriptional regulator [Patescibacteria group bacterium]MBU4452745.1 YebC/PmpR family DNA-binding transcriptional regulator [Patescibacteria group bacterium]MCG2687736.1 YebC/PmpR family DNA-binding transcriptional regulator [Candidatus Parcubacteria bacterium]